jgi:sugar-specific transcriptional regulator TrmB
VNTDKIFAYLEQLELSPLEAKIYLILLNEGEMNAHEIIEKLNVHRTSIYPPLDSLFDQGLIGKKVSGIHTKFVVNDPEKSLRTAFESLSLRKKQELEKMETSLSDIIKELPKFVIKRDEEVDIETRFYRGKAGVKKIYEDVLSVKEQRSYVNSDKVLEIFPENLHLFSDVLDKNPEVKMFEIFQTPVDKDINEMLMKKNYFYKYLPEGVTFAAQDIFIYDGKVAIISFRDVVSGVVLKNRDLFFNFKSLFDVMWKLLPEVKK